MATHPLAGQPAPKDILVDVPKLVSSFYTLRPDPEAPDQRVAFGTSGHRGSSLKSSFNEDHILVIAEAIARHRARHDIDGPLFLGRDTHALSEPAERTAIEVFAAHGITVRVEASGGYTPTPAVSRAIIAHNAGRTRGLADGVVITPSHNPPEDGGFKYNPPHGGPADGSVTKSIEAEANRILEQHELGVKRLPFARARSSDQVEAFDFRAPYVEALGGALDMEAIARAGLKIGVDPLGGSGLAYWDTIADRYGLEFDVVNRYADPTFGFMTVDKDGRIRMDCSSPFAMAGLIAMKDRYDVAFGNDADYDRHGIVTRSSGLLNPNHYLAVAIEYLFTHRPDWPRAAIGKTLVSSSMIDRVGEALEVPVTEVPVGFKWFVDGLADGSLAFGGEESAGASFVQKDGGVWTTDKDGILLDLLAAEIIARTGKDPGERYQALTARFGAPVYERIDAPATDAQKRALGKLSPSDVSATELAGHPIRSILTEAPGNGAPIGGLKVVTERGWFAARPSGTEAVYKIYAESFDGPDHLKAIQQQAQTLVDGVIG